MRFLFVVILALLPCLGSTQDGGAPEVLDEADETFLNEIEAEREQRQRTLEALQGLEDGPEGGPTLTPEEQLKKLGYTGPMNPATLLDLKALEAMEKLIREAKMWELPSEDVRQQILRSFEGTVLAGVVKKSPKLQSFMVDFLRDKEALLSGIAIFKARPRLKTYLYFWIGIMFAAYYTRKIFVSKFWKKPVKIFAAFLFSLTISVITLSTFCLIFEAEMKPIIALCKKHF